MKQFSKYAIIAFILSVNINGPDFFYTREISFLLLLASLLSFENFNKLSIWFEFTLWYFFSLLYNLFFNHGHIEITNGLFYYLGFVYLILLVLVDKSFKKTVVDTFLFTSVFVSIFIIVIWILTFYSSEFRLFLIGYLEEFESERVAFILMIRDRKFLDFWIPGVYFGTAPIMIPALAFFLGKMFDEFSWRHLFVSVLLLSGLIATAARANVLSAFVLITSFLILILFKRGYKFFALFLSAGVFIFLVYIILAFLSDTEEGSLEVKDLHYISYIRVFEGDLFRTFFTGWGGGSEFYTLAYNDFVELTELSYLESVRRFGLLMTLYLLIRLWYKPVKILQSRGYFGLLLVISIFCYLFVAGTNPYLFGSIGFLTLVFYRSLSLSSK